MTIFRNIVDEKKREGWLRIQKAHALILAEGDPDRISQVFFLSPTRLIDTLKLDPGSSSPLFYPDLGQKYLKVRNTTNSKLN